MHVLGRQQIGLGRRIRSLRPPPALQDGAHGRRASGCVGVRGGGVVQDGGFLALAFGVVQDGGFLAFGF